MTRDTEDNDSEEDHDEIDEEYAELTEELSEKIEELSELQEEMSDDNGSNVPDPDKVIDSIIDLYGLTDVFDMVPGESNTGENPLEVMLFGDGDAREAEKQKSITELVSDGVDGVIGDISPESTVLDGINSEETPVTMNLIEEIVAAHPDYTFTSQFGPDNRKYIMLQLFDEEPNQEAPSKFVSMVSELNTDGGESPTAE